MVKLSEIQKPINVAQFSNKKIFIKRFCANGTFVENKTFDNGNDFNLVVDEPFIDYEEEELSTEELSEFEGLLEHMQRIGNTYSRMFSIPFDKVVVYKQFAINIKQYVKDKVMPSRRIFQYRIKQFISFVNSTSSKKLTDLLPYAIQYLKEYLEQYITSYMNNGANGNIMMALGLQRYLLDRSSSRVLQRTLKRIHSELASSGTVSKINQKRMQLAYRDMFANLIAGLSTKIKDPMKRAMLDEFINSYKGGESKPTGEDEPLEGQEVA